LSALNVEKFLQFQTVGKKNMVLITAHLNNLVVVLIVEVHTQKHTSVVAVMIGLRALILKPKTTNGFAKAAIGLWKLEMKIFNSTK
jgi:hypothetical protein